MDKDLTPTEEKLLRILENRGFWIAILAVAVVGIGIGVGRYFVDESHRKTEAAASEKLFEVEKIEGDGAVGTNYFSEEFMKKRLTWPADKKEKMISVLQELLKSYPDTAAAQNARLRLASLAYVDAKYEDALKYFSEAIQKGHKTSESVTTWSAIIGKGSTLENLKRWDDALKTYQDILNNDKNPLYAEALLAEIRIFYTQGKKKELEPLIKKMHEGYANTPYDSAARAYEAYSAR